MSAWLPCFLPCSVSGKASVTSSIDLRRMHLHSANADGGPKGIEGFEKQDEGTRKTIRV